MLRSLLLLLLVSLVLPTVAAADDALVRGAFGSGTLLASSSRAPAPPCSTPPATPESVLAQCAPMGAAAFGTCINAGRDQLCDISVTAQPRHWVFRRWAPQSNRCAGATNPVCTFRTRETDCDNAGGTARSTAGPVPADRGVRGSGARRRSSSQAARAPVRPCSTTPAGWPSRSRPTRTRRPRPSAAGSMPGRRRLARDPHARRRPGRPACVLRHRHRRVRPAKRSPRVPRLAAGDDADRRAPRAPAGGDGRNRCGVHLQLQQSRAPG